MKPTIAFIGIGNMAGAIIGGLIASGYPAKKILGTSRTQAKREHFEQQYAMITLADNREAVSKADVVVLCVKPAQMQEVVSAFADQVRDEQMFISVAAGIELSALARWLGKDVSVVRCMPNTPSQLGAGVSGLIANAHTGEDQKAWVSSVFESIGVSIWVEDESQMHAVTALSGSSPAYFFQFLEAMIKAGKEQGLSEETCRRLAANAMLGAARMATELEQPIDQLRKNITSPKGTTEQALLSFEASGIDNIVRTAMLACMDRSKEMAQLFSGNTDS